MRKALPLPLLLLLSATIGAARPSPKAEDLHARAMRIHRSAIVVDTHEDVPYELEDRGLDRAVHAEHHRPRRHPADEGRRHDRAVLRGLRPGGVRGLRRLCEKGSRNYRAHPRLVYTHSDLTFADSPAAIRDAKRKGKIAVLIGIEGGHAIENSLGALAAFHRLGVRYMTLTHTNTNAWADSSGSFWSPGFDPRKYAVHDGLTDFGREVVLEMNRVGMLVDVSHVSDATIADVLETSRAPVFASHSSCRALSNIPRNLTDDQIRAITAKGGVVMVNISSMFLDQKVVDAFVAKRAALQPQLAELADKYKDEPKKRDAEVAKLLQGLPLPRASWGTVVDHIERVLRVGGPGSAGLGTDFDGIEDPPEGLEDVSKLPVLTEELLRRGHSEEEVRGVLGENFLRFWDKANAARAGVPARSGPLPMSKP